MDPFSDAGQTGPRASAIGVSGVTVVKENDKGGMMGLSPESVLFKERIIRLYQDVDEFSIADLQAKIQILEAQDPNAPIRLYINSPGGSVIQAMAMYDTIQLSSCPIIGVATGYAASAGSLIFMMCKERYITPNAMVMIHQLRGGGSNGPYTDQAIGFQLSTHFEEQLERMYQKHTHLPIARVRKLLRSGDNWLTAQEAVDLNLADQILVTNNLGQPAYGVTKVPPLHGSAKRSTTRRKPVASKATRTPRVAAGPAATKKAADKGDNQLS